MARSAESSESGESMGYRGEILRESVYACGPEALTLSKQLLTIWRKAKGKERDALLWGDEVQSFRPNIGPSC